MTFFLPSSSTTAPSSCALLVRAPGVDAERPAEPVDAARLVDVAVQRQRRLVAPRSPRAPPSSRPARSAAGVLDDHVRRRARAPRPGPAVRRAVQAEDRALGRRRDLVDDRARSARRAPARPPRGRCPTACGSPSRVDTIWKPSISTTRPSASSTCFALRTTVVDLELVVVAGADEAADAAAASRSSASAIQRSTVFSICSSNSACQRGSSSCELGSSSRVGAERVVAAADDRLLERGDLVLAVQVLRGSRAASRASCRRRRG